MPTPTLSLLARDLLLQAQARIEAHPALTLFVAAFEADHAPLPSPALGSRGPSRPCPPQATPGGSLHGTP